MATISDIGLPDNLMGILHPKQKNRWRVTFANLGGGASSVPLTVQATKVSKPKLEFTAVELHRYNSVGSVAGKHKWSAATLTVEDDVKSTASAVIQAQLQKQQLLIGAQGQYLAAASEGSLYKFIMAVDTLDGNDLRTETWIYEGCWIQSIGYGELDYAQSDAVTIDLTINFDHAHQSVLGNYDQNLQGIAVGAYSSK